MNYKYLLFDADNTLFDFDYAENKAFLSLSEIDEAVFTEENYSAYHEINKQMWKKLERKEITKDALVSERFVLLYRSLGYKLDKATLDRITYLYPRRLALGGKLIDGAFELVSRLSEKYEIYIITNGITEIQRKRLELSEISPYIKKMFVSEEIGCEKPDFRYFDYVLDAIGDVNRENYIVIGDSLTSDIDGAIRYGIDCIYYDPKSRGNDGRNVNYTVSKLKDIVNILSAD